MHCDNVQIEVNPTPHLISTLYSIKIHLSSIHQFSDYSKNFSYDQVTSRLPALNRGPNILYKQPILGTEPKRESDSCMLGRNFYSPFRNYTFVNLNIKLNFFQFSSRNRKLPLFERAILSSHP